MMRRLFWPAFFVTVSHQRDVTVQPAKIDSGVIFVYILSGTYNPVVALLLELVMIRGQRCFKD